MEALMKAILDIAAFEKLNVTEFLIIHLGAPATSLIIVFYDP